MKGLFKMAFDFKKEYKEFYAPKTKPNIIDVPEMKYLAVSGKGDPNTEDGEYKQSIELLYPLAYTIRMSYKGDYNIEGYFEFVVPPLEGFWWIDDLKGMDYDRKDDLNFISLIRMPDFVTQKDFEWAIGEATKKKKQDFSKVEFITYDEGLAVQCMHIGSYDDEPETTKRMAEFAQEAGYEIDISDTRHHHEIYISDPRRTESSKLKTVIRHPVRKIN